MIEPILLGIVVGLIPITLAGLFFAAYMQYRRSNQFDAQDQELGLRIEFDNFPIKKQGDRPAFYLRKVLQH